MSGKNLFRPISKNSIFIILLINVIFSSFLVGVEFRSIIVFANYIFVILFISFWLINYRIHFNSVNILILFLFIYLLILVPFSSNKFVSFNYYIKYILGLGMFLIGYSSFKTKNDIYKLIKISSIIILFGVFNFILFNFFSYGHPLYRFSSIYIGYSHNLIWIIYPLALLTSILGFFLQCYSKKYKILVILSSSMMIITFLLIFKRTIIIIFVLGILLFPLVLNNKNKFRFIKVMALFLLIAVILFPLYSEIIENNIKSRYHKLQGIESLQREARYKENIAVFKYITSDIQYIIFGSGEVFNSRFIYDRYGIVGKEDRQIHGTYPTLLWSGGFIALSIYIFILALITKKFIFFRKKYFKNSFEYVLSSSGLVLCILVFFIGFSGGWNFLSYQSYAFTYLGAFLGYLSFRYRYLKENYVEA